HRQHKEDGDIEVLRHPAIGKGQSEEGHERSAEGDIRRQPKEQLVGVSRDQVFFNKELKAVRDRLQPAELAADASGPESILDSPRDLAFQQDKKECRDGDKRDEDAALNNGNENAADRTPQKFPQTLPKFRQ